MKQHEETGEGLEFRCRVWDGSYKATSVGFQERKVGSDQGLDIILFITRVSPSKTGYLHRLDLVMASQY